MTSDTPNFLVLGANGYLGRSLVSFLASRGSVICNHRSGDGKLDGDLADESVWNRLPSKCATVFLAAGQAGYNPLLPLETYVRNNIQIAIRLLKYITSNDIRQLIVLSTASIYLRAQSEIFEEGDLQPSDLYALSRLMADQIFQGIPERTAASILRLSYPYGPGQKNRLIPLMAQQISSREKIKLENKPGQPRIRPLYIDDFLEAIGKLIDKKPHGIFNLGGAETVSIKKLAEMIASLLEKEVHFQAGSTPSADFLVNSDKIYKALQWNPSTNLETGLQKTLYSMELV